MSPATLHPSSTAVRVTLRTLVFAVATLAAIFFASAGLGLLRLLVSGLSSGADPGIAELATHSGLTLLFFGLAGIGAYIAKKSFW